MVYIFAVLIYSEYEQLTQIYNNVSGTSKKKLSQYGHQIFNVFSNIANCFWKGVKEPFPEISDDIAECDK